MKITMLCLTYLVLSALGTSCGNFATEQDLEKLDDKVNVLSKRVAVLENDFSIFEVNLNNATNNVVQLQTSITDLNVIIESIGEDQAEQLDLIAELQSQTAQLEQLETSINALQGQMDTVQLKLTELALEDRVVAMIDPCPQPFFTGYSEVLMRTSQGHLVAYFESGSQRHLTVLRQNVAYRTTDAKACNFKINANNEIILN